MSRPSTVLEEAFYIKYDSLSGKIGHAEECLAGYASGPTRQFADIIRAEMQSYGAILEEAENDFGKFGADAQWMREVPLSPRRADKFSKIMTSLGRVSDDFSTSVDGIIPFLRRWRDQRADGDIGNHHRLLSACVSDMAEVIGIGRPVLALFGTEFMTIDLKRRDYANAGHIIIAPESQRASFPRWAIAAHELGHAYYDLNRPMLEREVLEPVIERIGKLRIENDDDETDTSKSWWYWIEELVSDLIGVRTLGPVFAEAALEDALGQDPSGFRRDTLTHPTWEIRMTLVKRALRELDLEQYPPGRFENMWDAYESAFVRTEDAFYAGLLKGGELDDFAIDRICRTVTPEPVRSLWAEMLEVEPSNVASHSALACLAACAMEKDPAKRAELERAMLAKYPRRSDI